MNEDDFQELATIIADVMRDGGTAKQVEDVAYDSLIKTYQQGHFEGRKPIHE